jgi:hypothetical protein
VVASHIGGAATLIAPRNIIIARASGLSLAIESVRNGLDGGRPAATRHG